MPPHDAVQMIEDLIERNNEWWRNESHCKGEMRELGVPDDADAPKVCMGDLYRIQKALQSETAKQDSSARAGMLRAAKICEHVYDGNPYAKRYNKHATDLCADAIRAYATTETGELNERANGA